jgi:N-acetyl-anhydromuramyl-L-alanine amidase AmpD
MPSTHFHKAFRLWRLTFWNDLLDYRLRELQVEVAYLLEEKRHLKQAIARMYPLTMPDFPTAQWVPSEHFLLGHARVLPRFVQIHTVVTDNSATEVAAKHEANGTSMHYIISPDGSLIQCVSELNTSLGAGVLSSGYEHFWTYTEGNTNLDPRVFTIEMLLTAEGVYSQEALTTAFVLIKSIVTRHRIPRQTASEVGGVMGHYSSDPQNYGNCGKNFPYSALVDYLNDVASIPTVEAPVNDTATEDTSTAKKTTKRVKAENE